MTHPPAPACAGRGSGHPRAMSSRFWIALLVAVLVAALTYVVSRRLFGVGLLLLPLFFIGRGRSGER